FLKDDVINLIILLNRLVVVTGLTLSFVFLTSTEKRRQLFITQLKRMIILKMVTVS
ncbi:hypothetical protein SPYSS1447_0477, partial [Streptococcus pyogenes SS1447]